MHKSTHAVLVMACAVLACTNLQLNAATATSGAVVPAPSPRGPAPTSAQALPSGSPTTTAAAALPSGSGPCMVASSSEVTIYRRPSVEAEIFSSIVLSTPEEMTSRTADGWLGFDPGIAQAANIGIFRLRWIPGDAPITLSGGCSALQVAEWVPKPGVCYEMGMSPVDVHAAAEANSAVPATLAVGDFVAILSKTGTGWLSISGDQGNRPGVAGFIPESEMNVNGPCDSIPTVPG